MKPTSSKIAIALLQTARRLIDSGQRRYICHAVEAAGTEAEQPGAADELVEYIQDTLTNEPHYLGGEAIISDCLPISLKDYACTSQLPRLAWLDAMIRDLTTTGALP